MHDDTRTVLDLFMCNPTGIYDAHDVARATLLPYQRARRCLHNLARYGRVKHVGGYLYALPD